MNRCEEWVRCAAPGAPDPIRLPAEMQCGAQGHTVRLSCPAGRPDATACYCDEHGGEARAEGEARLDWNYLAPESVGDADAVEAAGCQGLQTTEAYLVVRQAPAAQGGVWLAWLGLGSLMVPVPNPEGVRRKRGGRMGRYADRPPTSFATREAALEVGTAAWRHRLDERIWDIFEARGSTWAWGSPVEALDSPIVIELGQHDERPAWDIAPTLPRRGRRGMATLTGLRPSGECA